MTLTIQTDAPPLRCDETGAVRVGGTRVLLELVVWAFQDGATPEAIALGYPSLALADVYATVAYYLRHPQEIDGYLAERERLGERVRERIEAGQDNLSQIRQRLRARRGEWGSIVAPLTV